MFDSGSRGSRDQIRQLAGMRGLMAKPQKKLTGGIGDDTFGGADATYQTPTAALGAPDGVFAGLRYRSARASRLTAKDTVVLTDFSNNTGDAVFDGSLKQALKVALGQSPFLNILPERKVRATLKLMTQPANTPISPSIAREVCQANGPSLDYINVAPGGQFRIVMRGA